MIAAMEEARLTALSRYFAERPELAVVSAYLFGSHAAGRAHRESDVDVAVLLDWSRYPDARERFEARLRLGTDLIAVLNCNDVDLVILNDLPPLFSRHILYEGRRVYLGDAEADRNFLVQVQLLAADLQPFLERMRRLKLEALQR
jgi:predicted nucleotidyltransferase